MLFIGVLSVGDYMSVDSDKPEYTFADLANFGITHNTVYLYCRKCGALITKTRHAVLLGTHVKYGVCKKYSHGASICKET